jgi:hypothetical protein
MQTEVVSIFNIGLAAIVFSSTGHIGIGWVFPGNRDGALAWEVVWIFRSAPGRPVFRGEFYWFGCRPDPESRDEYFTTPALTGKVSWQGRDNQTQLTGFKVRELAVTVSPEQAGTVTFADVGIVAAETDYKRYYYYEPLCDCQAALTANPAGGWQFKQWEYGGASSKESPLTLVMDDDRKVTAVFEREPDKSIIFKDPNLEAAMRDRLDKPSGDIYTSDLETLDWLVLDGGDITDLSGLEYCVNLTKLTVRYNEVADIAPVAALKKLEQLYIEYTPVQDISAVAGLTSLTRLYLDNNRIVDITPVNDLTKLEYLFLDNNSAHETTKLRNIGALSKLNKMLKLSLRKNQIADVSALAGMSGLIYLDIEDNHIADISALESLTCMEILWAENNEITDISAIAGWTKVNSIDFSYNQVADIAVLAGLSTLWFVMLDANQISDISALAANQGLGQGDALSLAGNLLDHNCDPAQGNTADCDIIRTLEARGVSVTW